MSDRAAAAAASTAHGPASSGVPIAASLQTLLAWYFVVAWGSGYLATRVGLQYAAPFTFLVLRFTLGVLCLLPWLLVVRPRWPTTHREWLHVGVAGLLMHAVNLSASHYAQYLGMSAGTAAVLLATQPLLTALFAHALMGERLQTRQWLGVVLGLAGVVLVVWHKIDVRAVSAASLCSAALALTAITAGTLYQRVFCPTTDLRSASLIQFALAALVLAPLAWFVEGAVVRWSWMLFGALAYLVIVLSILATNVLHALMRRGAATSVTSLFFLTPVVAVLLEWMLFGETPTLRSVVGIVVTCAGVALVTRRHLGRRPRRPAEDAAAMAKPPSA